MLYPNEVKPKGYLGRNFRRRFTEDEVRYIRMNFEDTRIPNVWRLTVLQLALLFGVNRKTIMNIKHYMSYDEIRWR